MSRSWAFSPVFCCVAEVCCFIVVLLNSKEGHLEPLQKHLQSPRSSVQTTVPKIELVVCVTTLWWSGRKTKLTPSDERKDVHRNHSVSVHSEGSSTSSRTGVKIWADESEILICNDKRYVRWSKGEAFKPQNTVATVKHGGGSVMLWRWYWFVAQSGWNNE